MLYWGIFNPSKRGGLIKEGQLKHVSAVVISLVVFAIIVFAASETFSVNNPPIIRDILDITVKEGELAILLVHTEDPDGDDLTIIYLPPFDKYGDWKTKQGDAGNYIFTVAVSDEFNTVTKEFNVVVLENNEITGSNSDKAVIDNSESEMSVEQEKQDEIYIDGPTALSEINKYRILEKHKAKLNKDTKDYLVGTIDDTVESDYIIKFQSEIKELKDFSLKKEYSKYKITKIRGKAEDIPNILEDSDIEYVELDQDITSLSENIPYGIDKTKAPNVWNDTQGDDVKVAILDTGIASHDDLDIAGGVSFVSDDYTDTHGHGTMVAGVLAALYDDYGLVGVAPEAHIYAIKIANGSTGKLSGAISGMEWAINNSMDIISMSFGMGSYSQIFKEVIEDAFNNGTLLIAAAGNTGSNNVLYPAAYSDVIAVGAVDEDNSITSFSSYGHELELVSAGVDINSTNLDDSYNVSSGTSYAAPHVAGVAALLKAYNNSLTNEHIRAQLRNSALDLGAAGKDDYYGYGLVQVDLENWNFSIRNETSNYSSKIMTHSQFCAKWAKELEERNVTDDGYNNFCDEDSIYMLSFGDCSTRYVKDAEDQWNLDTDGTIANQESYFHDELTGEIGILDLDGYEYANFYINHTLESTWQNFSWIFDDFAAWDDYDAKFYCYNYSKSGWSLVYTYQGSYADFSIPIGNGCIDTSPLRLWIKKNQDNGNGSTRFREEWITFVNTSIDCDGESSTNLCNGTITANSQYSNGDYVPDSNVTLNSNYNGATNAQGQLPITINNVECGEKQNVSVYCHNNGSQICQAKSTAIDFNGDEDSLFFNCDICRDDYTNLYSEINDVFISANGDNFDIRTLVHSTNVQANNVNVTVKAQSKETGLIVDESDYIISSVEDVNDYNATVTMDLEGIDYLHIYIDPNDDITSEDATDNYVLVPVIKNKLKANLSINTGYSEVDTAIRNYLRFFIDDVSQNEADAKGIIAIGKKTSERSTYNQNTLDSSNPFGLEGSQIKTSTGNVKNVYAGIVGSYKPSGSKPIVFIYGNRIEGTIAALKEFISARDVFLSDGFFSSNNIQKNRLVIMDDYDASAIAVMDLMHNDENKNYFQKDGFEDVVTNILNDNNFEISIKTVKTLNTTSYNQSTILRLKHVNSDYSQNYKDAVVNNSRPVVFGAGLWGDLFSYNDFATELATDANNARDSWLIEITGGPNQDCDTCPNYNYDDLVDYYWPALIAGVEVYSGQNAIDYVSHSNGCRVALSSLNEYSSTGKNNASFFFDYDTGDYEYTDLSSNLIKKFLGIACPSLLNENTDLTDSVRRDICVYYPLYCGYDPNITRLNGDRAIETLNSSNKKHITLSDYGFQLAQYDSNAIVWLVTLMNIFHREKISLNLMDYYNDLAISNSSNINLSNLNVNELHLFNVKPHDVIVNIDDQSRILNETSLINNENKHSYNYSSLWDPIIFNHITISRIAPVKKKVLEVLE